MSYPLYAIRCTLYEVLSAIRTFFLSGPWFLIPDTLYILYSSRARTTNPPYLKKRTQFSKSQIQRKSGHNKKLCPIDTWSCGTKRTQTNPILPPSATKQIQFQYPNCPQRTMKNYLIMALFPLTSPPPADYNKASNLLC